MYNKVSKTQLTNNKILLIFSPFLSHSYKNPDKAKRKGKGKGKLKRKAMPLQPCTDP
jgi:hypothetical protein